MAGGLPVCAFWTPVLRRGDDFSWWCAAELKDARLCLTGLSRKAAWLQPERVLDASIGAVFFGFAVRRHICVPPAEAGAQESYPHCLRSHAPDCETYT